MSLVFACAGWIPCVRLAMGTGWIPCVCLAMGLTLWLSLLKMRVLLLQLMPLLPLIPCRLLLRMTITL